MIRRSITAVLAPLAVALIMAFAFAAETRAQSAGEGVVFIPGKTIGLVPPSDFVLSTKFSGFEHTASGSSLLVVELPPEAYAQISVQMTDQALASKGITITSRKPVKVGGADGIMMAGTQQAAGRSVSKWIVILGTKEATVMVTAQDLSGSTLSEASMKAVVESIAFRASPGLDAQVQELPFALGDLSGFRIVRAFAGSGLSLTKGPKDIVKDASQPLIIIVSPLSQPYPTDVPPSEIAEKLIRSIATVTVSEVGKTVKATVAGAPGHETVAAAKNTGSNTEVTVSQWLRLDKGRQIRILAIVAKGAHDGLLADLRTLAAGLSIK
ncbi:MAG: hypothetical protein ACR2PM_18535 [Hyphomicrobiales bacterium]